MNQFLKNLVIPAPGYLTRNTEEFFASPICVSEY